jgi:hypothetical protein
MFWTKKKILFGIKVWIFHIEFFLMFWTLEPKPNGNPVLKVSTAEELIIETGLI